MARKCSFCGESEAEDRKLLANETDRAFSGQFFSVLKLPNKFRTRAELVRIGVGNPDVFKID